MNDITERKQAKEKFEIQREQIKSLFDYSGEAMALLDLENHIIEANLAFEEVFGYPLEEAHGKVIEDLICPERFYYTEAKELDGQAMQRIKGAEIIRMRKDGKEINVRVSAGPIKVGGAITGRFVIFDDITERKHAEEALQQERDKLQDALDKVKTLSGLLPICSNCKKIRDDKGYWSQIESYIAKHSEAPICSNCKKIRDDKGYWSQIESYIAKHSEADFTHSICPECAKKLYPEFYKGD
jgi:PAS domain S-box-containing protein